MSERGKLAILLALCLALVGVASVAGALYSAARDLPIASALVSITGGVAVALAGALALVLHPNGVANGAATKSPPNP